RRRRGAPPGWRARGARSPTTDRSTPTRHSRGALAGADGHLEAVRLAYVGLLARLGRGRGDLAQDGHDALRIDTAIKLRRCLAGLTLGLEELQQGGHGVRNAPRDDFDDLPAEPRALLVDAAPEVQLIHGEGGAVYRLRGAMPADVRHVVLAARIG